MQYSGEENLKVMNNAKNYNAWLQRLITQAMSANAKNIIDFGAGDGIFAKSLTKQNKQIICIEPAQNLHSCLQDFTVFASLDEVKDKSQDFIYSLNVLEHIEDDVEIIKKIYQKLKSGGSFFIYVPAFQFLYSVMDKKVGHFRRYSRQELIAKFHQAGFNVAECRYADFAGFFASIIFKFLPNQSGTPSTFSIKFYDKFIFPLSLFLDKITKGRILGKNLCLIATKK